MLDSKVWCAEVQVTTSTHPYPIPDNPGPSNFPGKVIWTLTSSETCRRRPSTLFRTSGQHGDYSFPCGNHLLNKRRDYCDFKNKNKRCENEPQAETSTLHSVLVHTTKGIIFLGRDKIYESLMIPSIQMFIRTIIASSSTPAHGALRVR
jgi:hypothetical protein